MIVVDTNVISEIPKTDIHRTVQAWLDNQRGPSLYATAISLAEITFGIEKLPYGRRKDVLRENMETVFGTYFPGRILPFDEYAARAYGRLVAEARANGRSILIADGQIAAIAKVHGFTIATRDTAPFEAAGIPVIDPWILSSGASL
ncbi:type II toxin-antitoxin system VapC family toxin [Neorhizobium sp. NCHU2750]|uniref:type II toxin-antitoxin system VapC family toxin n=1 Tax=Neorhizobium sp. NCHU2750 TaxID=1825976 RepID=UPI000E756604|nr:plasmid stability protein StbB [Neorhizobium sp. NCHU2750]